MRWWLYGGDDKINAYVEDVVAPPARELGVQIRRVPVTDTADALQRVVAERRAGKTSGGAVDLIWINGENFATGKQAGLWLRGWARGLPNARRYVDQGDPAISRDFQVSVDGQESPWQRAAFVYAYDSAKLKAPPQDFDALLAYAKAHPGRVTSRSPDFTGSAFVRQRRAGRGQFAAEPAAAGGQARPDLRGRGRPDQTAPASVPARGCSAAPRPAATSCATTDGPCPRCPPAGSRRWSGDRRRRSSDNRDPRTAPATAGT